MIVGNQINAGTLFQTGYALNLRGLRIAGPL